MSRFVKFALCVFFALAAFVAVARADTFLDDDGKEIVFFDSKVGDNEFEDDVAEKRSLNIRGKSNFGMANFKRKNVQMFTHAPEEGEEKWGDNVKITWYASHDLLNPACGNGSWDPTNTNHIGAVMNHWEGGPSCGDFIRLCNPKIERCVRVRIVDECAGCSQDHVDLTKSAFRRLATTGSLDEGITAGLSMWTSKKPNPWDFSLFGPFKLQQ